ncbi:MAG TPA: patatin-like phospholipase family protein [Pseudonocardiaceae bacterium]|jgi:predicted patatin/cPLA2 family phospholipase|nr:patatin-like phospholipase family protein [Pseudonocardiaceae bacterium]
MARSRVTPAPPPWTPDHPVRRVLRARRAEGSAPGRRTDAYRVGLAIEGGGMRGIVSGAMITALEDLGYADAFDEVYATSSGAVNAAYFMVRGTWYPLSIYFDDLTTGEFLDFRRLLRGVGPMDLDYVFDVVLAQRKPLDYDGILASAQRLHVMVTDVDDLVALDVSDFTSARDLRSALQASAWLPIAVRGTATFRGHRAVDGGVLRFHPFRAAQADGCTHILSLSTRPMGTARAQPSWTSPLVAQSLDRIRPGLGAGFVTSIRQYVTEDRPYLTRSMLAPDDPPAVLDVAPLRGTPEVKRHEQDRGRLLDAARTAYQMLHLALEHQDVVVVPRLTAHRHIGRAVESADAAAG